MRHSTIHIIVTPYRSHPPSSLNIKLPNWQSDPPRTSQVFKSLKFHSPDKHKNTGTKPPSGRQGRRSVRCGDKWKLKININNWKREIGWNTAQRNQHGKKCSAGDSVHTIIAGSSVCKHNYNFTLRVTKCSLLSPAAFETGRMTSFNDNLAEFW